MTLLFEDKQDTVAYSEDTLQIYIHKLEIIISKHGLKISTIKTKTISFKGRDPIRSKTVTNNNIIEQTLSITYVCCSIAHMNEKDVTVKISTFLQITEIIKL